MPIQPRVRIVIAVTFFAYVLLIRTYDLANSFLMLGEQTRDWAVALGSWTDLPLTGAPSTAGGRGFGPAYYWILWIGRVLVGPFTDNLPHAGGLWVAFLQSAADTCLLVVLARRVNVFLAVAACLLIASAPFDVSISGVIWNPPVAAALVKMATAMALGLGNAPSPLLIAATAAVAGPLTPTLRGKSVAVAQFVGLGLALAPVVPASASTVVAATTLAALVWSFAVDVARLRRSENA